MAIKFPKLHIATSVTNRILNVRDELESGSGDSGGGALITPPPDVPDPTLEGAILDLRINEPPGDVPPLETSEPAPDELAGLLARGDDLITA